MVDAIAHCGVPVPAAVAERCIKEAAAFSGFGRYSFANNPWMLRGTGDRGFWSITRVWRDYSTANNGGYRPEVEKCAKFSSLSVGVRAWLKAHGVA